MLFPLVILTNNLARNHRLNVVLFLAASVATARMPFQVLAGPAVIMPAQSFYGAFDGCQVLVVKGEH